MTATKEAAARRSAGAVDPDGKAKIFRVDRLFETGGASRFEIPAKKASNDFGMVFDNVQGATLDAVAQRNHAAHPHALLLRSGDLVPDPLSCDLALELREGQEDVQGQSSHTGGGVERLSHRDEGHVMGVEQL